MKITVTVDEAHQPELATVAQRLRSAGMDIDQVLEGLGIITGSVAAGNLPMVEMLDGVASVDEQMGFQLPPPEDEIQ